MFRGLTFKKTQRVSKKNPKLLLRRPSCLFCSGSQYPASQIRPDTGIPEVKIWLDLLSKLAGLYVEYPLLQGCRSRPLLKYSAPAPAPCKFRLRLLLLLLLVLQQLIVLIVIVVVGLILLLVLLVLLLGTPRRPPPPRSRPSTPLPPTPHPRPRRPYPRPSTTTRPRRPTTPCPRPRTPTPTKKIQILYNQVKITLGSRKNNIFTVE